MAGLLSIQLWMHAWSIIDNATLRVQQSGGGLFNQNSVWSFVGMKRYQGFPEDHISHLHWALGLDLILS